ncbi:MAG: o-succinylbenzoate synthase [Planctomycetota bacterium]
MNDFAVYRFSIPLRQPLGLKGKLHTERHGLLIEREGRWAEASPLPGFSQENLDETIAGLDRETLASVAMRFAISSLDQAPIERLVVPYNGLLLGNSQTVLQGVDECVRSGCRSVKLKVGRTGLQEDIDLVCAVRDRLPQSVSLRLDANQAWSFEDAIHFTKQTKVVDLEYIEEPLCDPRRLETLYFETGIRYALDESLMTLESLDAFPHVAALICKPTLLGGIDRISQLAATGKKLVFSAAFESGVGTIRVAQLAASLAPEVPAGLDTLDWFTDDLLFESPIKRDGVFTVRGEPQVDTTKLERVL